MLCEIMHFLNSNLFIISNTKAHCLVAPTNFKGLIMPVCELFNIAVLIIMKRGSFVNKKNILINC